MNCVYFKNGKLFGALQKQLIKAKRTSESFFAKSHQTIKIDGG